MQKSTRDYLVKLLGELVSEREQPNEIQMTIGLRTQEKIVEIITELGELE